MSSVTAFSACGRFKVIRRSAPCRLTSTSPSLTVWPDGNGSLYYIDTAGAVIELETTNHGETWT